MLTLKEDFDKTSGTSLPMFSRAGKSTISQYSVFNQALNLSPRGNHIPGQEKIVEDEVEMQSSSDDDEPAAKGKDKKGKTMKDKGQKLSIDEEIKLISQRDFNKTGMHSVAQSQNFKSTNTAAVDPKAKTKTRGFTNSVDFTQGKMIKKN